MDSYFNWILQNPGLNHLTVLIFEFLDTASLNKCLKVSQLWNQFIKQNTSIWKRHLAKESPLHNAISSGQINMVELLLDLGFDVNGLNGEGQTPLSIACSHNRLTLVKLLCQHPKIDVNARTRNGETPLIKALLLHWGSRKVQ